MADAKILKRRLSHLQSERAYFEEQWEDIWRYIFPRRVLFKHSKTEQVGVYDNTAIKAHKRFAAALHGLLTNPAIRWFELAFPGKAYTNLQEQSWLQSATTVVLDAMASPVSNFYAAIHEAYLDLTSVGTCVVWMEPDKEHGVARYKAIPIGECFIAETAEGMVDTLFRRFKLTAAQAMEEFADDAPPLVWDHIEKGNHEVEDTYVQCVYPSIHHVGDEKRAWKSVTFQESSNHVCREGGFSRFPFAVARWSKAAGEAYGTGLGQENIADVRTINYTMMSAITNFQKHADPPLLLPDDGFMDRPQTRPGGINRYRAGTNDRLTYLVPPNNPMLNERWIEGERMRIKEGFYGDLLELPMLDRMTAEEVMRRQNDRMHILSPSLSRIFNELLVPLVMVSFESIRDVLEESPNGMEASPEFRSPLAISQRSSMLNNWHTFINALGPMFQFSPGIADHLDEHGIVDSIRSMVNVPGTMVRSEDEVAEIRERREEAMQRQQEMQNAQQQQPPQQGQGLPV